MKILIIDQCTARQTLAGYYSYAFQQLGIQAHILNMFYAIQKECLREPNKNSNFLKERLSGRIMRIIWRLKRETRQRIIGATKQIKPDIVMAIGSIEIEPDIFKEIRGLLGTGHIFCYLTEPLSVDNSILESIPLYDCIFTFSKFQVPLIYWFGARRVEYLPFAYDPRIHKIVGVSGEEKEFYASDIAYLGTWQPYIEFWIKELTAYSLKVWGNHWYKSKDYPQVKRCWQGEGAGLFADMAKVINSCKIIFNVIRYFNGDGHSMKTFEIPACGGFMLTNRTEEQLDFFPEDKCAVYFSTREELQDKIKYYLHNDVLRMSIAREGYRVAEQHTYTERAKKIINLYQKDKCIF